MRGRIYLAKRVALSLGLLSLGAAMAWAISLVLLQDAAIAAGALPQPGEQVGQVILSDNELWRAAKTLSSLERAAGALGAALVLGYGVVDRFESELVEAFE